MTRSTGQKWVIVNADDFGFSPGVTEGILRAHANGIVTSTTIIANMPAAPEAASRLAEAPDLLADRHLLHQKRRRAVLAVWRALAKLRVDQVAFWFQIRDGGGTGRAGWHGQATRQSRPETVRGDFAYARNLC